MVFFFNWIFGKQEDNDDVMESSKAVSFKIGAQDFGKFDGRPEHWYAFKNKTMSTLGVAGFSSILDKSIPIKDQEGNHRVYYLFEGATNDGSASHIVKQHEEARDGRAAWYSLKDWFEGKTTSGDIAKTCRIKLQALELMPKGDANIYINDFIRLKNQLESMDEGEHPATLIDQFLDQIKDNKYEVTVTNLRMDSEKTLQQCIEAVRRHDLVLSRNRTQEHRFTKIRRLAEMDDISSDTKTSGYIEPAVWQGLTSEQRQAIIQSRKRKNPGQDDSNKGPNGAFKYNRACHAKAAKARRAKRQQKTPEDDEK
jgi:hypothetical protein